MAARFVDFHCHLDLYPDFPSLVRECDANAIYTLAVTTTPRAWPRNHALASATRYVRAALGFHPQLVAKQMAELALWEQYLPQTRFVGEVGLDAGPHHFRSLDLQKKAFEHILRECARLGGKILSVHSVRSAKAVLDLVEQHLPPDRGRVVLHWWTGSHSDARRAIRLGCYFSVNAPMLRSAAQSALVATLPSKRILTESDGPFATSGDRPARPGDVARTVEALAALHAMEGARMAEVITANLHSLLSETASSA